MTYLFIFITVSPSLECQVPESRNFCLAHCFQPQLPEQCLAQSQHPHICWMSDHVGAHWNVTSYQHVHNSPWSGSPGSHQQPRPDALRQGTEVSSDLSADFGLQKSFVSLPLTWIRIRGNGSLRPHRQSTSQQGGLLLESGHCHAIL